MLTWLRGTLSTCSFELVRSLTAQRLVLFGFLAAFPALIIVLIGISAGREGMQIPFMETLIILLVGLIAGSVLSFFYFLSAVAIWRKKKTALLQSADERGTGMLKNACTTKIAKMLRLAREMHAGDNVDFDDGRDITSSRKSDRKTSPNPALQAYILYGESRESCASWSWVFKGIISKKLFEEEGIWIPSRLWTVQVMQVVILSIYSILLELAIDRAIYEADTTTSELPEGLPEWIYSKIAFDSVAVLKKTLSHNLN